MNYLLYKQNQLFNFMCNELTIQLDYCVYRLIYDRRAHQQIHSCRYALDAFKQFSKTYILYHPKPNRILKNPITSIEFDIIQI